MNTADTRRQDIAKAGWTYKERHIDKNPELPLLGIRLTNAGRLFEESLSIQIFNRSEVSLSRGGLTNDDHVSLTKDDGRDFLDWLRTAHPEILTEEVYSLLPEGPREGESTTTADEARSKLIAYCVRYHAEYFGPGSFAAGGAPLEESILAVLRHRDNRPEFASEQASLTMRMILSLEEFAHENYKAANAYLREAHDANEAAPCPTLQMAMGAVQCGNWLRHRAQAMRAAAIADKSIAPEHLPEPTFPEAINYVEVFALIYKKITEDTGAAPIEAPATPPPPAPGLSDADLKPGMLVVVIDENAPQFRQMAEVERRVSDGRWALIFKGDASRRPILSLSQIKIV